MKRQSGKTYKLAHLTIKEPDNIMIVPNYIFKENVIRTYKDLSKDNVFTMGEVLKGCLRGRKINKIFVDEVGACLSQIHPEIKLGTHTDC